ncbi:MAG: hypothetical protein JSW11_15345 [Candidatus Heimdallarchaeota archaeon]|nr:MAG: hypothetical protein JSW11_15345 [Candidatus Heimdallarchaeota archaeon]
MSTSEYRKPDIQTDFSSMPTWLYLLVVVILYAFGAYSFVHFIFAPENTEILESISEVFYLVIPVTMPFLPLLIAFAAIFLFITIILAYIIVWIMSKLAQEVTIIVCILFPLFMVAVGALIYFSDPELWILALFIAGLGALFFLFVLWKFTLIKRSGQFVEFSAQLVLDEKAVIAMPIFLGIYSIITGFFMLFGFFEILSLFTVENAAGDPELSLPGYVFAILFEYIYLIVYLGVYYSLSAGVISYASDWYRGLDPDLNSAMKDVRQVFPIIIKFAFAMATVKMIMQIATSAGRSQTRATDRQGGGAIIFAFIGAAVAGLFISILGAIWMFMNYFTLISIVQNKRGLTDSIKDSAKTTWNSLLDVLVGESGFGLTTFIFAVINSLLWIVVGFGLGFAVSQDFGFGIIFAFIFLILGSLPYNVVTMPMKVAFRSFLYSYAKDTIEGYKKPSRLPTELRTEFSTLASKQRKRRGLRDPNQYF